MQNVCVYIYIYIYIYNIRAWACIPDTTPAYPPLTSNLQQTKNETTNVVINIIVASSKDGHSSARNMLSL